MPRSFKVLIALSLLFLLVVAISAVRRHRVRQTITIAQLYKGIRPVPINAPPVPAPVLRQLVNADFEIVTNLGYEIRGRGTKSRLCKGAACLLSESG